MKICTLLITLILPCIIPLIDFGQNCNNWARISSALSGIQIGDLDITGNQITVEAVFNRTTRYVSEPDSNRVGDIVSKHTNTGNINYLLRPNHAYITAANGFFETPAGCNSELNKTYHVALVYNGATLKFYRNGFLLSEIPATGNLVQSDLNTIIGSYQGPAKENLIGYINEVRIWNVARTQSDIKKYVNQSLPNPASQTGLLAYYTFDNLKNKQGNSQWDGTIIGDAKINQANPACSSFVADSCYNELECNSWGKFTGIDPAVEIGDLDITGDKVTVEAMFNRDVNFDPTFLGGDIVSKHTDPSDANYLLRPVRAEVTTTTGWHATQDACTFNINKTYYVALVYDGKTLKFYRNGFLMSEVPCTGNLIQNNWITRIGSTAGVFDNNPSEFHGYINEVRIWNVAKTQAELRAYMNKPLPNPKTQVGLLAYYTFDDLKNKQGNSTWDGSLLNNASINQTNPNCNFVADSCDNVVCDLKADFTYKQNSCDPYKVQFHNNTSKADSIWWDFGNGKKAVNVSDTTIQYAAFGNYVVKLFAKTNAGCLDTAEYTVNVDIVKDNAIINGDTTICAGNSIQMKAVNGLNYCWLPAAGLSNTFVQNPVASPATTTKYFLQVLTDSSKPVLLDSVTITVIISPDVNAGNDTTVCGNVSVQLNASGALSYVWSPLTGLSNGTIANPVAFPAITTTYTVTGTDRNLCSSKDSVIITVNPVPVFTVTPQSTDVCLDDSVILVASGGDMYQWSPASTIANPFVDAATVFPTSNTTYQVIITNNVCKLTDTLTANVSVNELPSIAILKSNDIDCINYQAQLTATGGIKYDWLPDAYINNTHVSNPIVNPPIDTWYSVKADGVNDCSTKDSILVKSVFNPEAVKFEVANAFTPNHDGLNDCFSVKYWAYADVFDISIFSRWGQLIYHSKDINGCWDGTFKGQPQPAGTYIYKISVSTNCTEGLLHKNGTLALIR